MPGQAESTPIVGSQGESALNYLGGVYRNG